MAALLKAVHEFAESTAQEPAGAGTAEALAQLAEEAADATLPGASGSILPDAAKYFGDLVPVLIAATASRPRRAVMDGNPRLICVAPLSGMGNRDTTRDLRARSRT